ncbi:MAG TPA: OB-fold domain-containing protein [Burkholderiaceae bacterium]|nr:OB-fold domain-containing protein [Burkholderiaceae bacterium]
MAQSKTRVLPSPGVGPDNEVFVAAARQGRFVLRWCDDCGKTHWYPRAVCPHCLSTSTQWKPASGRGTVYSYSTMQRAEAPFTLAYVTLDEGPTMLTNLVDPAPGGWRIGQSVQVRFVPSDDGTPVAVFGPA